MQGVPNLGRKRGRPFWSKSQKGFHERFGSPWEPEDRLVYLLERRQGRPNPAGSSLSQSQHPSSKPSFLEPPPQLDIAPPSTPGTKRKLLFVPQRGPQCNLQGAASASCAPASVLLMWFSIKVTLSVKLGRAACLLPAARCGRVRSTFVPVLATHHFSVIRGTSKVLEQHLSRHKVIREHFFKRVEY